MREGAPEIIDEIAVRVARMSARTARASSESSSSRSNRTVDMIVSSRRRPSIARSEATKRSRGPGAATLDRFASLAMTARRALSSSQSGTAVERDQALDARPLAHDRPARAVDQHLGNQRARVVGSGLHGAIGAGGEDGEQIALRRRRDRAAEREIIAGLANRPDDVGENSRLRRRGRDHRNDLVPGVVERRADEIVHAGVDDDEGLGLALLHIEDARHEHARIADDQPARLEHELAAQRAHVTAHDLGVALGMIGLRVLAVVIRNAEAAAEIDVRDRVTVGAQIAHELREQREGFVEGAQDR